jgi:SAM-dependent methyltransferase
MLLDVGCGPLARAEVQYSVQDFYVVGVDISKTTIKQACENVGRWGNPRNVSLIVADGEYLPFKAESFDVTLCLGTISYFPDKPCVVRAVEEMRDATRQHGTIYISWWVNFLSSRGMVLRLELKILSFLRLPHPQCLAFIGASEIRRIMEHCALHVRQIRYAELLALPWFLYQVSPTIKTRIERMIAIVNNYHKSHAVFSRFSASFEVTCGRGLERHPEISKMYFAGGVP